MLWALYQQDLDPLNNRLLSTLFAALPVVVLFWLLVPRRWLAPKAGATAALTAIVVAWLVYKMPPASCRRPGGSLPLPGPSLEVLKHKSCRP